MIRGKLKIVLIFGQSDLAMFLAKANCAPVCRASNVATFRRAAQCALVCEAVTLAPIRAKANLPLQPRPRLAAERRRNGNIAIRCGEVDLAAAGGGVNAKMPCGVARGAVVCEIGHPCVATLEGRNWRPFSRGPMFALLCGAAHIATLCGEFNQTAVRRVANSAKPCLGKLSAARYVEIPDTCSATWGSKWCCAGAWMSLVACGR